MRSRTQTQNAELPPADPCRSMPQKNSGPWSRRRGGNPPELSLFPSMGMARRLQAGRRSPNVASCSQLIRRWRPFHANRLILWAFMQLERFSNDAEPSVKGGVSWDFTGPTSAAGWLRDSAILDDARVPDRRTRNGRSAGHWSTRSAHQVNTLVAMRAKSVKDSRRTPTALPSSGRLLRRLTLPASFQDSSILPGTASVRVGSATDANRARDRRLGSLNLPKISTGREETDDVSELLRSRR